MMTQPRLYPRLSWWRRVYDRLDAGPLLIGTMAVCTTYVALLAIKCIVHAATGLW